MGVKDVLGRKNSKQNGSKIRPCLMPLYKRKKQCDWNWMNEEKVVRNEVRELMVYSLTQVTIKMLAFTGRFSHLSPFFFFFFFPKAGSQVACATEIMNLTFTDLRKTQKQIYMGEHLNWTLARLSDGLLTFQRRF